MEELLLGVLGAFLFKKADKWREAQAEKQQHFEDVIRRYKRGEIVARRAYGQPLEKEHLKSMVGAYGPDKEQFLQFIDLNYNDIQ